VTTNGNKKGKTVGFATAKVSVIDILPLTLMLPELPLLPQPLQWFYKKKHFFYNCRYNTMPIQWKYKKDYHGRSSHCNGFMT
jgi:hypothetical protein